MGLTWGEKGNKERKKRKKKEQKLKKKKSLSSRQLVTGVTTSVERHQVTTYLMGILRDMYMPGVSDEGARDGSCYEVRLNGSPWSHNSSYNLGRGDEIGGVWKASLSSML